MHREVEAGQFEERTEAKMYWGVKAFCDWHEDRLQQFHYDPAIYWCDLQNVEKLEKENLIHAMCHFISEMNRKKGDGMYPGRTLYQLVTSIQKYLHVNKLFWKLLDDVEFGDICNVLDNVMKERTQANVGTVKKEAKVISYDLENELWLRGILGEESPDQL